MKSARRCGLASTSRKTPTAGNLPRTVGSWRCSASTRVEGWLEGYILSGRHGLINSYEPFIHVIDSMFNQHAKWLESATSCLGGPRSLAQPVDHGLVWQAGPQWLHAPGPWLSRRGSQQEPQRCAHLPAARCQLLAVRHRSLPAQHQLCQCHRRRQEGPPTVFGHGRSDRALHEGHRDLELGQQ